jgi:hypothetical protein
MIKFFAGRAANRATQDDILTGIRVRPGVFAACK